MNARLRTYFLVLAAFAATAGTVMVRTLVAGDGRAPDIGALDAVYAREAQRIEPMELTPGATFGQILTDAGLDANEQSALLLAFREQASPRRMRAGTEVRLVWRGDREWLNGIEVDINRDETVRLDRSDVGWLSSKEVVSTFTDTVFVAGQIGTILWNSVMDHEDLAQMPPGDRARLIHRLDQVFQWQVDFSRQIRQGDYYRFAFERHVRPDGSMRDGSLISAELVNEGRSYHAIWFDPNGDGEGTYYDLEGQSVRRAFLKKPLEFRRIASR
ncbi:MAG: hypothetical protein OEO23_14960, partial [Gemmatimonadota bacterium]|nr:hypothetical protein [Gemmatimonadota bacterium]